MSADDTAKLLDQIRNRAWMVRHYARGGRSNIGCARRNQAIQLLGLTVREALSKSDDYEAILGALVEGLHPRDEKPF